MKKTILLLCAIVSLNGLAQISFNSGRQMVIGSIDANERTVSASAQDTLPTITLLGSQGPKGEGARIAFGDNTVANMNVQIGELGETDTDIMWLHGKHGLCYTHNPLASDTVFSYNDVNSRNFNFNCGLSAQKFFVKAPSRGNRKAESIEDRVLDGLMELTPMRYIDASSKAAFDLNGASQKEGMDSEFYRGFYDAERNEAHSFGLVADDVEKYLPELVYTDASGNKYIDYIGLIPLLIQQVQELNREVQILKSQGADGQPVRKISGIASIDTCVPFLGQNAPNPFNSSSVIVYELPTGTISAQLVVYDLQGRLVKNCQLDAKAGNTQINLSATDYRPGVYLYSLIADGKEIDVKRMIITE